MIQPSASLGWEFVTCIRQSVTGKVAYNIPWPGLSLEEKRDGYCLPCIAWLLGDFVIQRA